MAERPPAAEAAAGVPEPTPAAVQGEAGADGATPAPASDADPSSRGGHRSGSGVGGCAGPQPLRRTRTSFCGARADLENYRRRAIRERSRGRAREAKKQVLLRMLDVLDNLERALGYEQVRGDQVDAPDVANGLAYDGHSSSRTCYPVPGRKGGRRVRRAVRSALARGRGDGRGPGAGGGHNRRRDTARLPP